MTIDLCLVRIARALCAMLFAAALPCLAQSTGVEFSESFLPSLPIPSMRPHRMAVDRKGDLYIADDIENKVVEIPTAGGLAVTIPVAGLKGADGIAVDGLGNIYIGDYGSGIVVELSAAGTQTTIKSGLGLTGINVAVDSSNNLYVSDSGNNQILEMPAAGGSWVVLPTTGLAGPLGIAVDAMGNLYVADYGNSRVVKLPWTGTAWSGQTTLGTGLRGPEDVKIDALGDILICDTGNDQVLLLPASGAAQIQVEQGGTPVGLAVDKSGNIYVATSNGSQISVLNRNLGSFSAEAVGLTQAAALVFNFSASTTLGSISATMQGASGLAFKIDTGGTCAVGQQFLPGSSCSVIVDFAPASAGVQAGSVAVVSSNGEGSAQVFLSGMGTGPEAGFNAGDPGGTNQTIVGSGLSNPMGTAVDAAGDVYIANFGNHRVVELPAGGGAQIVTGKPLSGPAAVAVDGAGNVFIADSTGGKVYEMLAGTTSLTPVGSGFGAPEALAIDPLGNVYVADSANNRVAELPVNGGTQSTLGTGLSAPAGVAIDSLGNIYISDSGNNRAVKIAVSGAQATVGTGLSAPHGVAVDAALNVYIADSGNNRVVMVPAEGGSQITLVSDLNNPHGLSVDAMGNLYIGDSGNNRVLRIDRSIAPPLTLSFPGALVAAKSIGSPIDEYLQNIGTEPLVLSSNAVVLSDSVDFGLNLGSQSDYCQPETNLNPGASCLIEAYFTPSKAGSLGATITVTDNSLNVNGAAQTIILSGSGLIAQTVRFPAPATPVTYGTKAIALAATASSGLSASYSVTGPAILDRSLLKITGAGTVIVTASQAGNNKYASAPPVVHSIQVKKAVLNVTASNASRSYGAPNPAFADLIAGYVNGDSKSVVVGTAKLFSNTDVSSPVGAYPIFAGAGSLSAVNYSFKLVAGILTITAIGKTQAPVFKPAAGTYKSSVIVTIADATHGAAIYYTTNGTMPSRSSTRYTAAGILVSKTETVKAVAFAPGYTQSETVSEIYGTSD
jgi:sugar lactone lactonase YvrE